MSVKENLIAAKALIADPANWIKGQWEFGNCFCAVGAVQHVSKNDEDTLDALYNAAPNGAVMTFNDDPATTHADIMALFDRAIEAAE